MDKEDIVKILVDLEIYLMIYLIYLVVVGGGFGQSSSRRGPVRGADLRYNLNLDFKEVVLE